MGPGAAAQLGPSRSSSTRAGESNDVLTEYFTGSGTKYKTMNFSYTLNYE